MMDGSMLPQLSCLEPETSSTPQTDRSVHSSVDASILQGLFRQQSDEMQLFIEERLNEQTQFLEKQLQVFMQRCDGCLAEGAEKPAKFRQVPGVDVKCSSSPESEIQVSRADEQSQKPSSNDPIAGKTGPSTLLYLDNQRIFEDLQQATGQGEGHKHARLFKELHSMNGGQPSIWHEIFNHFGLSSWLATELPTNSLAKITYHQLFTGLSALLVLVNTCILCQESDSSIKSALREQGANAPQWVGICNIVFNTIFFLEVLFKMLVLGTWFFVSPGEWGWNLFDLFVVVASIVSDLLLKDVNVSFLRALRFLRAVRAARLTRVLRFFRELRKILLAIIASIKSLLWCFVFLFVTMLIVSVLLLQGLAMGLNHLEPSEYAVACPLVAEWYGSLWNTMFSLLRSFTGGAEWHAVYEPLTYAGALYQSAFVFYILFVLVGIMNVLTGVFLVSANDFLDHDLVVQDYRMQVESFVRMMLDLFQELDLDCLGEVDWPTFKKAINADSVQAYLAANGLEPLHAHLIFDLLDEKNLGKVNLFDFVMGMTSLKGVSTAIDSRVIMRQIGLIPEVVQRRIADAAR